jgi:ketosteroid isomerase-like protein
MKCRSLATPVLILTVTACFASENPSAGGSAAVLAAREQVTQRLNAYLALPAAGNAEPIVEYWTPESRIYEPEMVLTGPQLVDFAKGFFEKNTVNLKLTPTEISVHDGGNVAYVFAHCSETVSARDGKTAPVDSRNNIVVRWVKADDGAWRMDRWIAVGIPKDAQVPAVTPATVATPARAIDERLARQQVAQRMKDWTDILVTGDAALTLNFWHDDAWFFDHGMQLLGKPAMTTAVTDLLASNRLAITYETTEISVHDQGSVAYQLGNYEETVTPRDGNATPTVFRNHFIARWRRGADDAWRMDRFLATPQPKPAPQTAAR